MDSNDFGKDDAQIIGIENLPELGYNPNRDELLKITKSYYEQGKINKQQLDGILQGNQEEISFVKGERELESNRKEHNQESRTSDNRSGVGKTEKPKESEGLDEQEDRSNQADGLPDETGTGEDNGRSLEEASAESSSGVGGKQGVGRNKKIRSRDDAGSDGKGDNIRDEQTESEQGSITDESLGSSQERVDTKRTGGNRNSGRKNVKGSSGDQGKESAGILNFIIDDDSLITSTTFSQQQRTKSNLEALTLLNKLTTEDRIATTEEKKILVGYVGWGGIPNIFDENKPEWGADREKLKSLLTEEEYAEARKSTLNAHYTSPAVIRGMYRGLKNIGFESGRILEPSMGTGHFFGLMPEKMQKASHLYGLVAVD